MHRIVNRVITCVNKHHFSSFFSWLLNIRVRPNFFIFFFNFPPDTIKNNLDIYSPTSLSGNIFVCECINTIFRKKNNIWLNNQTLYDHSIHKHNILHKMEIFFLQNLRWRIKKGKYKRIIKNTVDNKHVL